MSQTVIIPHQALDSDTLRALVEEYVSREGTDYGHQDFSLENKVNSVLRQLESSDVVIVFNTAVNQAELVARDQFNPDEESF